MLIQPHARQSGRNQAFTLVELLLAVSLMLLVSGAVICNFSTLDRGARLEEGSTQTEMVLRYARAQAASSGRKVKVIFGDGDDSSLPQDTAAAASAPNSSNASSNEVSGVRVLWEPDPLEAPGKYCTLPGSEQLTDQLNDLVRVAQVRPPRRDACPSDALSPSPAVSAEAIAATNALAVASATSANSSLPAPGPLPELTCYPDGSSDSAEIVLRPLGDEDMRVSVVTLSGVTGQLSHRFVSPSDDSAPSPDTDSALAAPTARPLVQ